MTPRVATLDSHRFGIDPARGFLPSQDPPQSFGDEVQGALLEIHEVGQQIPELLESQKLRRTAQGLPVPDCGDLKQLPARKAIVAARVYAFLASAYIHQLDSLKICAYAATQRQLTAINAQ